MTELSCLDRQEHGADREPRADPSLQSISHLGDRFSCFFKMNILRCSRSRISEMGFPQDPAQDMTSNTDATKYLGFVQQLMIPDAVCSEPRVFT